MGGITPAHAGKRTIQRDGYDIDRDHPRTCGEKVGFIGSGGRTEGSPPHMRGKASASALIRSSAGITPAHAGKSRPQCVNIRERLGSPPHMRGKEVGNIPADRRTGITPAHAGKREQYPDLVFQIWDHPRTCGEKRYGPMNITRIAGSPPHMRGKVTALAKSKGQDGITPAHAGKSCRRPLAWSSTWDHPRTCGEKQLWISTRCPYWGSPPHMRGKEPVSRKNRQAPGITPAHAGKRLKRRKWNDF